ncbi:beta-lactamase regulating signal transducer with metallopeptidase domain [Gelidibacter sediminis]|uniref:Beta-lactamase regulating signal transducer with metallopeptidase domain n=1 Tax=Gelidibacter sediminis TaxID=1608710 RepID=A0A4V3F9U2_9FLAO|nr:M56 family metallopeptidase [Gelidibacter sediminis]TDU43086.1 beta-lactamase regulating signal transducer with metallopeptidase domain [Gelidibacter sediminis]
MFFYLLKSAACLAIFMVFYKYVLEKENMHIFKRYYLLGTLVLAFTIPLVTFTQTIEVITSPGINEATVHYVENTLQIEQTDYLALILWSIYGLGVLLFGTKFLRNLYQIIFKIYRNPKKKSNHIVHVLLSDMITPHTFFKYIFLNKQKFENEEIPQEVFWHEEAHAIQKHSVDVLFIELLQVFFWFNPIIYFTKHSIKMNHEFLADQAVLNRGVNADNYQHILLAFSSNATAPIGLANAINYSSIRLKVFGKQIALFNAFGQVKKRFTVMKTHTTKRKTTILTLLILPVLAILIFSFGKTELVHKEMTSLKFSNEDNQTLITDGELKSVNESTANPIQEQQKGSKVLETNTNKDIILLHHWYITIANQKYYYPYKKGDLRKYYDKYGKEVTLDIVKEYTSKYNQFESLTNEGEHYVKKSDVDKKQIDHLFSDLGGMYFRMSHADKNKVIRPKTPITPYLTLTKANGDTYYKLKSELTEEDQKLLKLNAPPPPKPAKKN